MSLSQVEAIVVLMLFYHFTFMVLFYLLFVMNMHRVAMEVVIELLVHCFSSMAHLLARFYRKLCLLLHVR